jgi:hypothetical protein
MASIMIPAKNNTGATNHCLDLIAGLGCPCRRGQEAGWGYTVVGAERCGVPVEGENR